MYVLVVREKATLDKTWYVADRKEKIRGALEAVEEMYDRDSCHWRAHDGSGWYDSSPDAYLVINELHGRGRVVFL